MRVAVIGDTHGRADWKTIVAQEKWDRVIFLGDYFDAWGNTGEIQIPNFEEIVAYKRADPETVELLIGNHDFHYLAECGPDRYSGYQTAYAESINKALLPALDVLKIATQVGERFLTHAGITQPWVAQHKINKKDLVGSINKAWKERPEIFRFYQGDQSGSGDHRMQGPLWVRPNSLIQDFEVPNQIVGHTTMKAVTRQEGLVFADTIATRQFVITNGDVEVGVY